ncbi:RabGAP/TBC protein [Phanerochaete sordida]|uniref:RabGAP/TBC protein n=1 Tax=Phanerochaete sordida TaxID=48140 RepID=A0A9P3GPS7_9APHY|nr:RabGAP/TBC protein [Phanerochaete sordida]
MAERGVRPEVIDIKVAYDTLFNSSTSLSKVKDAALGGRLLTEPDGASMGVAGRSLAWKLFLIEAGPLQPQPDVQARIPLDAIKTARTQYQKLFLDKMRAPDGGYEEGVTIPGTRTSPRRTERTGGDLDLNNPLSLHNENPWTAWFAAMELRKTILQDVERTFPDIEYFRDQEVQTQLTNILFVYSVTHPDIGYRQGMHELLAPLYYAVDHDTIPEEDISLSNHPLKEVCSPLWVAADAWALFDTIMRGVGRWYEWRETKNAAAAGKTPLPSHVQLSASGTDGGVKPYVSPIVEACNHMQNVLLKSVDPQLWRSLQASGIEPQIYGIRWLRLLFTREFSLSDAMVLWDGLFACDPSFDLASWVCVAMLIRIRNQLIPADYSTQLTFLLRYPALEQPTAAAPYLHPCSLLLRQALTLQMSPTPPTGVSVVHENMNLLGIPTEVPDPPPPPTRRRPRPAERGTSQSHINLREDGVRGHFRQGSNPMALPEMIARGLLERGESLGINKTVMNAVSELKRNLPDLANSLPRLPLSPPPQQSSYALTDERPPSERPPWEPRTRFEMEKETADLKALQRRLGDSVGWIVDTLLLDDGSVDNQDRAKSIKERKREAVECLSYVRDVLKGSVPPSQIEEDRLVGEEELKARRAKELEKQAASLARAEAEYPLAGLTLPQPAATAPSSLSQPASTRRSQDYFTMGPSFTRPPAKAASPEAAAARVRAPSPTPTISVLSPNANAMPLAPWNHSRSMFTTRESPRMPSRPSAVASGRPPPRTQPAPQTPAHDVPPQEPVSASQQDPLGVLR